MNHASRLREEIDDKVRHSWRVDLGRSALHLDRRYLPEGPPLRADRLDRRHNEVGVHAAIARLKGASVR